MCNTKVDVYPVIVDDTLSLKEMVEAGKYDRFDSSILEREIIKGKLEGKGRQEVQLELIRFDDYLSTHSVLRMLDEMGYRPVTVAELLAFGAKYPDKQKELSIIALGTVFRCLLNERTVAFLCRRGLERCLLLGGQLDGYWRTGCRFLVARK